MFVHTVIMVIEPHMKQGRQHKLISTIFLATSVTKKLDHNISFFHATVSSRSAPSKVFPFSETCSPCSLLCALHRSFSSCRSALLHCSLCPSSKLTELTIKCVWICFLSLWVATSTSNPFHADVFSASCKAFLCACSGVIFSSLW